MARTARKTLPIYDSEVLLTLDANSIDFAGSVSGTVDNNGNVKETFSGGGSPGTYVEEVVSGNGTSWTLAHTPVSILFVEARGQTIYPPAAWSNTGTALTTTDSWTTGDILVGYYY